MEGTLKKKQQTDVSVASSIYHSEVTKQLAHQHTHDRPDRSATFGTPSSPCTEKEDRSLHRFPDAVLGCEQRAETPRTLERRSGQGQNQREQPGDIADIITIRTAATATAATADGRTFSPCCCCCRRCRG